MPEVADLLLLQQKLRLSDDLSKLGNLIVNDTAKIAPYETAVLWLASSGKVEAVSGLPEPARNVPFTDWMDGLARELNEAGNKNPRRLVAEDVSAAHQDRWKEFLAGEVVWIPLTTSKEIVGGLLISRQGAWKDEELGILGYWGLASGHALDALRNKTEQAEPFWKALATKRNAWIGLALLVFLMLLPVDLTVNATAEIVPREPDVVRAPIEGIIGEIHVEPNQVVETGQLILSFDDTAINAQLDVVKQELAIATAEYQRANQAAVSDRRVAAQLPMLKARVDQHEARVRYNEELLARSVVYATTDAVAVVPDAYQLEGRPVKVGEKIMTLARTGEVELEFWLAVGDSIPLPAGAPAELFLNVYPERSHPAVVRYISYQAEVSPEGVLGFRGCADFENPEDLRVGWRGTAKVSGDSVTLFYYLFRRPLAVLRQWIGF